MPRLPLEYLSCLAMVRFSPAFKAWFVLELFASFRHYLPTSYFDGKFIGGVLFTRRCVLTSFLDYIGQMICN